MTEEDRRLISKYMGWELPCDGNVNHAAICAKEEGSFCAKCEFHHPFDLNDAGLCVEEMQKRGDWEHDFMDFVAGSQKWNYHQCIAWLFNRENFFGAMAAWIKERKK